MTAAILTLFGSLEGLLRRKLVYVVEAWRPLTRRHFLITFLLCLAWGVAEYVIRFWAYHRAGFWPVIPLLATQLNGFAVMLAVMVADRASPPALRRWWPYVVAVAVGVFVGSFMLWLLTQQLFTVRTYYSLPNAINRAPDSLRLFLTRHFINAAIPCGFATYIYVSRRLALHRLGMLRAAQFERARASRQVLESRLQAMQARIEPQFLFNTLAQVEQLYESEAKAADEMLDALIAYLRAALPQMRSTSSTLRAELELVRAYLGIRRIGADGRLDFAIDVPKELLDPPFPPMVLLPLVEEALSRSGEGKRAELRIAVGVDGGKLKITVADSGLPEHTQGALDSVRARLTALYGNNATLVLRRQDRGATETEMGIPYEHAETTDV